MHSSPLHWKLNLAVQDISKPHHMQPPWFHPHEHILWTLGYISAYIRAYAHNTNLASSPSISLLTAPKYSLASPSDSANPLPRLLSFVPHSCFLCYQGEFGWTPSNMCDLGQRRGSPTRIQSIQGYIGLFTFQCTVYHTIRFTHANIWDTGAQKMYKPYIIYGASMSGEDCMIMYWQLLEHLAWQQLASTPWSQRLKIWFWLWLGETTFISVFHPDLCVCWGATILIPQT